MRQESEQGIIVWRMDSLIESLRRIELEMHGQPETAGNLPPLSLRYNAKEALQTLRTDGYSLVTFSDYYKREIDEAIRVAGLEEEFNLVADAHDYRDTTYFPYPFIAEKIGLSPEKIAHNMVGVSNYESDRPRYTPGMVFIVEGNSPDLCLKTDAMLTTEVIQALDKAGDGDFKRGFGKLFLTAEAPNKRHKGIRRVTLPTETQFYMRYERGGLYPDDSDYKKLNPIIFWINSSNQYHDLTLLTEPIKSLWDKSITNK